MFVIGYIFGGNTSFVSFIYFFPSFIKGYSVICLFWDVASNRRYICSSSYYTTRCKDLIGLGVKDKIWYTKHNICSYSFICRCFVQIQIWEGMEMSIYNEHMYKETSPLIMLLLLYSSPPLPSFSLERITNYALMIKKNVYYWNAYQLLKLTGSGNYNYS